MLKEDYLFQLLTHNYIYIQEKVSFDDNDTTLLVATVLKTFDSLGYSLDANLINTLCKLSVNSLTYFYHCYGNMFKESHFGYWYYYKKFPEVKNNNSKSKFLKMLKDCKENKYVPQKNVLSLIGKQESLDILSNDFYDYFSTKSNISTCFIETYYKDYKGQITINSIYNFDKIRTYFELIKPVKKYNIELLLNEKVLSFVKKPDDIISVYALITNFGTSNITHCDSFKSLKRQTRRLFLSYLDEFAKDEIIYKELEKNKKTWKEIFKQLHVGEYSKKYPHIFEVATKFRNNTYITFEKKLAKLANNSKEYINLLKTKPEKFVKQLYQLLSNKSFDSIATLNAFRGISNNINSKDLIYLYEFFSNTEFLKTRYVKRYNDFYYEDSYYFTELFDERKPLPLSIEKEVINIIKSTLMERFSSFNKLGKVYIDKCCENYPLSIYNKHIDSSLKTLPYRCKIKIGDENEGDILRVFACAKYDSHESQIHSQVFFFTDDYKYKFSLSGGNSRMGKFFHNSFHISENSNSTILHYDIDYKKVRNYVKYMLLRVSLYSTISFNEIEFVGCGATLSNKNNEQNINTLFDEAIQMASKNGRDMLCFAIDLETLELIWIDKFTFLTVNNIDNSYHPNISYRLRDCLKQSMNLKDFLMLHSNRMELVNNKDHADFIISNTEDANLKVWDVNEIEKNWL